MSKLKTVFVISLMAAVVFASTAAVLVFAPKDSTETPSQIEFDEPVNDMPYEFVFVYGIDTQLPELPTGCEATAASILAKMQGAFISKTQIADALPKSGTDFVNAFIGDPYSATDGWACSAPAITNTLNRIFESREQFAAVELTGTELEALPLPAAVWVTIDMEDPGDPVVTQDGYGLFRRTHCVVVREIRDEAVLVYDPLNGPTEYPLAQFRHVFNLMGKQPVYVDELEPVLRIIREQRELETIRERS
jgi:uncharacterized protein YvpB